MSKRWAALLIGCGFLIVLFTLGYMFYEQRFIQAGPVPLPGEIAGQPLTEALEGAPALGELSWMHGQQFQLNQGSVGWYGSGGEATLYAAGTPFGFMAGRMITEMRDKIALVETPFTPQGEIKQGPRTIYELVGMGQQHYYFRSGSLVIWLAVNEQQSDLALQQVLDFYP